VPAENGKQVSPANIRSRLGISFVSISFLFKEVSFHHTHPHLVKSAVHIECQYVIFGKPVTYAGIEVRKVICSRDLFGLFSIFASIVPVQQCNEGSGKNVGPAASQGNVERGFTLDYRTFKLYPSVSGTQRKASFELFIVS